MGKKRRFSETESAAAAGEEEELAEFTKNDNFKWRLNYVKDLGKYAKEDIIEATEPDTFEEKACNRQIMMLPGDGSIYADEAQKIPFHHTVSTDLKPQHFARLAKHGIRLRSGPMSPSEVEKIMNNWKEFAKEYSIKDEDAFQYIGICGFARRQDERNEERKWLREVNFLPRMCNGLLDRSAAAVGRYLRTRFHPSVVNQAELYRPWTAQDEEKLKKALEKNPQCNLEELSVEMGRTRFYLYARRENLREKLEMPVELSLEEKYKLFQRIKTILHPQDPLKLLITPNSDWQKALSKKKVEELAAVFERTTAVIEREWKELGFLLIKTYNQVRDKEGEPSTSKMKEIVMKAFNIESEFNNEVLRKCLDYILTMPGFHTLAQINHARLTKWIDQNGFMFPTSAQSTGHHVLAVIQRALKQLTQAGYMDRLPLDITVRDLLELLCVLIDQNLFKGDLSGHNKPLKKAIKKFGKVLAERKKENEE